jgi:hypothetical protein
VGLGSNLGRGTGCRDCGFPESMQANAGIFYLLGHGHFLPNPFQFIIHLSSYYLTPGSFGTEQASLNKYWKKSIATTSRTGKWRKRVNSQQGKQILFLSAQHAENWSSHSFLSDGY